QGFQGTDEVRIMHTPWLTSSARTAYPRHGSLGIRARDRVGEFLPPGPDSGTGQPGRLGHLPDPSSADGTGFHRSSEAACTFIQEWAQDSKLRCDGLCPWVLQSAKHT